MNHIYKILALLLIFNPLFSQIVIDNTTLPDVGDQIEYRSIIGFEGDNTFKDNGENLTWIYDSFVFGPNNTEDYLDIKTTTLADSFPTANMLVNLSGFDAAALRTNDSIEIIGISLDNLSGFDIAASANFDNSFTYRSTPFAFGDKYDDAFDFNIQFSSDLIPGLDTIPLPIPGAVLDSIRITTKVMRSEEATAYGTLNVLGNSINVLKIEQMDSTNTLVEIGVTFFGNIVWLDATALIGDGLDNLNNNVVTYKFLTNGSKASILEFTENSTTDTLGITTFTTTGRMSAGIISNTTEVDIEDHSYLLYPNPTSRILNIKILSNKNGKEATQVKLYNNTGQYLQSAQIVGNQILLDELPTGQYMVHICSNSAILHMQSIFISQ